MDENSSPNQELTPLNSFESDVNGMTPISHEDLSLGFALANSF